MWDDDDDERDDFAEYMMATGQWGGGPSGGAGCLTALVLALLVPWTLL